MWQTPVSNVSPWNATPRSASSARAASTSGTRKRDRRSVRPAELLADVGRIQQVEEHVLAEPELGPGAVARLLEPERVAVEGRRSARDP